MTQIIGRHGDVLIEKIDRLPEDAKPREHGGRIVLAEGEATGHAHTITPTAPAELFDSDRDDHLYLRLTGEETVRHQEHGPGPLAPGIYRVRRIQRTYEQTRARRVLD